MFAEKELFKLEKMKSKYEDEFLKDDFFSNYTKIF
jgi:hypothetical protein